MWKFAQGQQEKMHEFFNALLSLKGQLSEIVDMRIDESVNPACEYDAMLTVTFRNLHDLEQYKTNSKHVAVSALCKSIRVARASIDIACD
jgi:hypothetical protein